MYKGHDVWGHDDLKKGYSSGSSKDQAYHSKEQYQNGKEKKGDELYNSHQKEDDEKKEEKWSELDEKVEKESKDRKKEEEHDDFTKISKHISTSSGSAPEIKHKKTKEKKSIEEAIDAAVKEEKERIYID